ncbi:MAG: amino acid permease [Terriglobales bacterium]
MVRGRKIGLPLATLLVASNMVGGIYLLPATLAPFGSITVLGWLLAIAGALVVARVLGRLGQHAALPGGVMAYAGRALGPFMGFQATAIYWMSCWIGNIALAVVAVGYLGSFVPALAAPAHVAAAAIGVLALMTLVNLLSPRFICQLESAALLAGMVPIVVVLVGGWWHFHPGVFAASWNPSGLPAWRDLPPSLVLMFWAFLGLESASIGTAFVENPERNVGRATTYGVLLGAAIFMASCALIMGQIPASELARSTAPFADAVRLIFGRAAGALVAAAALAKSIGSLGAWILLTTETGQAGAERGQFLALFAPRSRSQVPWVNLGLVFGITTAGVWLSTSATLGEQFGKIISVSTILTLLLYIYGCLSVWRYAELAPETFQRERGWAMAGLLICLAVIVTSGTEMLAWAMAVVLLTLPLYPFCSGRMQAREAEADPGRKGAWDEQTQ